MALTAVLTAAMTRLMGPLALRDMLPAPREVAEVVGRVLPRPLSVLKSGTEEENATPNCSKSAEQRTQGQDVSQPVIADREREGIADNLATFKE